MEEKNRKGINIGIVLMVLGLVMVIAGLVLGA